MAEQRDPNDGTAVNPGLPDVEGDVINDEVLQQGSPYAATATTAAQKIERTKVAQGDTGVDDGNVHGDNPLPVSEAKLDVLISLMKRQVALLTDIKNKLSYETDLPDEFTTEAEDEIDLEIESDDEEDEDKEENEIESLVT